MCDLPPIGGIIAWGRKAYGLGVVWHLELCLCGFRFLGIEKASYGFSQDAFNIWDFVICSDGACISDIAIYEVLTSFFVVVLSCFSSAAFTFCATMFARVLRP